ncbi:MAG: sigma-70 family RNA polymerase sigma factor [Anaerolineales bacterium]|jgi:RNA polymerase sigma-70 factor (ECF subfamily)
MQRSNAEWIEDLTATGARREAALADLRQIVRSGLPYSLSKYLSPSDPQFDALADEVVQDTLLRTLDYLDTFEGRSKFTTWVHKIAVRIALTELRRKRWEDVSLDEILETSEAPSNLSLLKSDQVAPDRIAERKDLAAQVQRIIQEELTDKQRKAILALGVHGMPVEEVARRMDMKRNALYKLLHDARVRLKARLAMEGLNAEDVLEAFE